MSNMPFVTYNKVVLPLAKHVFEIFVLSATDVLWLELFHLSCRFINR